MSESQLNTTVTCVICNMTMKCITRTHLAQHGHTIESYQLEFPEAAITSEAELYRRANNFRNLNSENKGKKRDPEIGKRISEAKKAAKRSSWNKGLKLSDEERAEMSKRVKAQYESGERVGTNLGKKMSDETKQKLRESTKRIQANQTEEEKQLIAEKKHAAVVRRRESGWVSPHKGTKLTPEHREKSIATLIQNKHGRRNKSDTLYQAHATERGFTVLRHHENDNPTKRSVELQCNTCGSIVERSTQYLRKTKKELLVCRTCVPPLAGFSNKEREVGEYIQSILTNHDIGFNDRSVLEGKEIDILIPDLKIGFEFNGLYWHSELNHTSHAHHILHKKQFAYHKGIRLITIFEDEWDAKTDIVKSRISHILNRNKTLCYARQCAIKQIPYKQCAEFLENNHIQGSDKAKLRYGAFFNDILVAVMTFKPTSFVKGGDGSEWELSRFAVCNYSNIPGIASKMLKRFNADHINPPLISYADARWSVGNVYTSIGFKFAGTTPPSYWYVDTNEWATREHRSRHMKHLILKRYPNSDPTKTEWEIMQDHKWDRVWDCGTLKYTMNVPE
jgi:hypothetical protein